MKTIKFENYLDPDKNSIFTKDHKFSVWLNWDLQYWFTDKKKLVSFIADLNRFLNTNYVEINEIYKNTFIIYRDLWFYNDDTDCNIQLNDFVSIDTMIHKIYRHSNTRNRNFYIYKDFFITIDYLIDILLNVRTICTQKKISVILIKIDNNILNLKRIKKELLNYSPENRTNIKNIDDEYLSKVKNSL